MANGNSTKKEPKIVENDHKSLKKQKSIKKGYKLSKIAVNGRKEQKKMSTIAKKTQIWIFKKTGKKHNKQEIQDMGVALLSCHALLRKYLQLLNLKLYD